MNIGRSGQWRPAVHPYLEELAQQVKARGRSEHSMTVNVRGVRLLVSPLEQDLALALAGEGDESYARRHVLIRDSLGLRIKLRSELDRLRAVGAGERDAVLSEINADVGLGCQLMHEITLEMNAITAAGKIEEARDFSQYRQQLVRLVSEADRVVSGRPESGAQAAMGGDLFSVRDPAPAAPRAAAPARKPPPGAAAGGSRTGLWIALGVVVVVAAIAFAGWILLVG